MHYWLHNSNIFTKNLIRWHIFRFQNSRSLFYIIISHYHGMCAYRRRKNSKARNPYLIWKLDCTIGKDFIYWFVILELPRSLFLDTAILHLKWRHLFQFQVLYNFGEIFGIFYVFLFSTLGFLIAVPYWHRNLIALTMGLRWIRFCLYWFSVGQSLGLLLIISSKIYCRISFCEIVGSILKNLLIFLL